MRSLLDPFRFGRRAQCFLIRSRRKQLKDFLCELNADRLGPGARRDVERPCIDMLEEHRGNAGRRQGPMAEQPRQLAVESVADSMPVAGGEAVQDQLVDVKVETG